MGRHGDIEMLVRGVLVVAGRVLLCRNRKRGHTFLPGGHIEVGERAADALKREFCEELGVEVTVGRLLGACEAAFDQPHPRKDDGDDELRRHHEVNLVFELLKPTGGTSGGGGGGDPSTWSSREDAIEFLWQPVATLAGPNPPVRVLPDGIAKLIGSSVSRPSWVSRWD